MSDVQSKRKRKRKVEIIEEITAAAAARDGNFTSVQQRDVVESELVGFPIHIQYYDTQRMVKMF